MARAVASDQQTSSVGGSRPHSEDPGGTERGVLLEDVGSVWACRFQALKRTARASGEGVEDRDRPFWMARLKLLNACV